MKKKKNSVIRESYSQIFHMIKLRTLHMFVTIAESAYKETINVLSYSIPLSFQRPCITLWSYFLCVCTVIKNNTRFICLLVCCIFFSPSIFLLLISFAIFFYWTSLEEIEKTGWKTSRCGDFSWNVTVQFDHYIVNIFLNLCISNLLVSVIQRKT